MSHFHIHIRITAHKATPPHPETIIHPGLDAGTFCSASFLDDLHHAAFAPFLPLFSLITGRVMEGGGGGPDTRIPLTTSYRKLLFY